MPSMRIIFFLSIFLNFIISHDAFIIFVPTTTTTTPIAKRRTLRGEIPSLATSQQLLSPSSSLSSLQRLPTTTKSTTTTTTHLHGIPNIIPSDITTIPNNIPPGLPIALSLDIIANQLEKAIWNGTSYPVVKNKENDYEEEEADQFYERDNIDIKEAALYGAINNVAISCRVYIGLVLVNLLSGYFPYLSLLSFLEQGGIGGAGEGQMLLLPAFPMTLTTWVALAISTIKRVLFLQLVSGTALGRVAFYDRLFDFAIFLVTAMQLCSILGIEQTSDSGVKAMLNAGGIFTLGISLASKSLAENIIGGITLQAYNGFNEGDTIRLLDDGGAIEGKVLSIGLVETSIVGYDNIIVRVPNSQLNTQRISNLSRVKQSRVKQTLRFKYSNIKKLPRVLKDIKNEIRKSCSGYNLIKDGSKPLMATLETYEKDHIVATVICHFDDVSPSSLEFKVCQQEVILAIARALEVNGIEVALPSIVYNTVATTTGGGGDGGGSFDFGGDIIQQQDHQL